MNQIICTSNITIETSHKKFKKRFFFKLLLYIFIILLFSFSIYYIYLRYTISNSEKLSKKLLNDYNITSIYNISNDYTSEFLSNKTIANNYDNISSYVIGIIEIKKINIVYPILSEINKDLLRISPCKFYGPYPNEKGNLCIAAHNYKNGTFFSNLSDLSNGDIITIYDLNGLTEDYVIYNVYKTDSQDNGCIDQNTNNRKIVTLITCDSLDNNYRIIVKARAI